MKIRKFFQCKQSGCAEQGGTPLAVETANTVLCTKACQRWYTIWNAAIVEALFLPMCMVANGGLIRENGGDRWRGKDNKALAGRRLLRGFLLNYVMGHVWALIAGL